MKTIYLLLLFIFTFSLALNAQTNVVLNAVKDNTIYSDNITNSNGAGVNFTTGATAGSPIRRGLLMFDLSAIPTGAIINAVSLRLVMNRTVSGASDLSLHRLNEDWGEGASNAGAGADGNGAPAELGDVTWICNFSDGAGGCTTSWSTAGGVFQVAASATTSVDNPAPYTWSGGQLITDVQDWVTNAVPHFGWVIIGDEAVPGSAKRFSSRTNPTVADRPTLTVNYTAVVLPINLLYFKAQAQNSGTGLSWKTAQEINNDFFEVEFSTDAVLFTAVGKVKGHGNTSSPQSYNFTHRTNHTGKAFYRLSQTDFNGHKTYSQVELVDLKFITSLTISPNPVTDKLIMPGLLIDGKQRYTIINLQGIKIVESALVKQEIMLPNNISPGMYMLRIIHSNGSAQLTTFIKY